MSWRTAINLQIWVDLRKIFYLKLVYDCVGCQATTDEQVALSFVEVLNPKR